MPIYNGYVQVELVFGEGDITVTPYHYVNDDDRVGVCFQHLDKCYEIGKSIPDEVEFDFANQDVIMVFDNEKSIDVIINALENAKMCLSEL